MNIVINEGTHKILKDLRKNVMTIYSEIPFGCWSSMPEVFVRLKEPEAQNDYNLYEVDGIKVFLFKDAKSINNTIEIIPAKYSSDLIDKEFEVIGLKLR